MEGSAVGYGSFVRERGIRLGGGQGSGSALPGRCMFGDD